MKEKKMPAKGWSASPASTSEAGRAGGKYKLFTILFLLTIGVFAFSHQSQAAITSGSYTLKLAGGNYSTWAAFWNDLGHLTGDITLTVDASAFTEETAPGSVTEDLNGHTLHILPASFPTKTDATDGARFTCSHTGMGLNLQMEGAGAVIIEGMVFIRSSTGFTIYTEAVSTEFDFIFRRNIIKAGTIGYGHVTATLNAGLKVYNNIIFDVSGDCFVFSPSSPDALIANNTAHNCVDNYDLGWTLFTSKNNLAYINSSHDFWGEQTSANGYNNASGDTSAQDGNWGGTGSNNLTEIADPFNDIDNDDFTITAEDVIDKAGLDLSDDFTDDFFGVTRKNWTIGACEYISPVAPPSVTTSNATNKAGTSVTGNGNITDIGSADVTTRGFKYALTATSTCDTWDVHEDGTFNAGVYSLPITGLTKETIYYYRGYAINEEGDSYGSCTAFNTAIEAVPVILKREVIFRREVQLK